ncbi:MAG: hypothetical protein WA732_20630 [Pseudolabrys sp.]
MLEKRTSGAGFPTRRQLVFAEVGPAEVVEPRLIVRDRRAERRKAGGENFDALKIGTRSVERTIEFSLYSIDCRFRSHNSP